VPDTFAVSALLLIVARAVSDSVHCVLAVTSCVVPSLRCATAFRTAAPPMGTLEGVAVTVRESRVWDEGLLHPVIKINKPHRSPEHTCGMGGTRIDCLVSRKFESTRPGEKGHFKGANELSHPRDTWCRPRNLMSYWCNYPRASGFAAITPIRHYLSFQTIDCKRVRSEVFARKPGISGHSSVKILRAFDERV
jgi:hypothetical protein